MPPSKRPEPRLPLFEPDAAVRLLLAVCFMITSGGLILQLSGTDPALPVKTQDVSSINAQIAFAASYLILIGSALFDWRKYLRLVIQCWPLFLFIGMAFVSAAWSPAPDTTVRRSIALLGSALSAIAFASRYRGIRDVYLLIQTMGVMLVVSILYVLAQPKFGVHQLSDAMQNVHAGQWRGVFSHRTQLGRLAGIALPIFLFAGTRAWGNRWLNWAGMAVAGLCLVLAKSGGGYVAVGLLIVMPFLLQQYQKVERSLQPLLMVAYLAVIGAFAFALDYILPLVLQLLGKDPTFTGRAPLWAYVLWDCRQSPYVGYSYAAGWVAKVALDLTSKTTFGLVPNAQNGYIDCIVSLGAIGLILALFPVAIAGYRALRIALSPAVKNNAAYLVPLMVVVAYIECNTVEAWLFASNNIATQMFFFIFAVLAGGELKEEISYTSRRRRRRVPKEAEPSLKPTSPNPSIIDLEGGGSQDQWPT